MKPPFHHSTLPGPATAFTEAVRISVESATSEHALDMLPEEEIQGNTTRASSQNTADETADLNFLDMESYEEFLEQAAYKSSDNHPFNDSSWARLFNTLIRGRAMPLRPLLFSVIWCTFAVFITWLTRRDYDRGGDCRWWCTPLAVDGDALSYVGFSLFLLTSFRASEAYGRYMEAARVWANLGGTITSFAKYVVQAFPRSMIHKGDRERILSFLVAFPIALKRDLRRENDLSELKKVLAQSDLARIQRAESKASYCLYVLSGYMLKARDRESEFPQTFIVHLIRWIADLAAAADVCTQIKNMPSPYSYVTHLNTFLALWLFFLPFAIVENMGWGTIVIVSFISYGVLGVASNAKELEDPFGSDYNDLPLGRMAYRIQDQVAHIYHTYQYRGNSFITDPPKDDMSSHEDFWLNAKAMKEKGGATPTQSAS